MRLGEWQELPVVKIVDFGIYLGSEEEKVLLPKKQVPAGTKPGDVLEVFIYKDSSDRPIATVRKPKLTLGETAVLRVADTGKMGAFLDWGLEKDLFLPFKEQTRRVKKGENVLAALYIDKSGRLCATMRVYSHLRTDHTYRKNDQVHAIVYEIQPDIGAFAAVDAKYSALIPKRELFAKLSPGDEVDARVAAVREDKKMDLSLRSRIPEQMEKDAQVILEKLEKNGGELALTDKSDPELIRRELGMSKAAFKRALGRLWKQEKVEILPDKILKK